MRILVTGGAGFIGFHLVRELSEMNHDVVAIDSFSDSNSSNLPYMRNRILKRYGYDQVRNCDVFELHRMGKMKFDLCVHLAAFPGVRNSEANPDKYRKNNIDGFRAVLDYCETSNIGRVFFASSSSVYGQISKQSKSKENFANGKNLRSVYAETKWQNELDAKSFFRRTGINCLALRFFTVYGPWGRPDMAYWKFAGALLNSLPISIYGIEGGYRSFSYVTDVVSAIECLTGRSDLPSALNVASDNHVATMHMLQTLCCLLGVKNPIINHVERPAEDVESTHADLSLIKELIEMHNTDLKSGLSKFCDWFIGQSGELSINGIL